MIPSSSPREKRHFQKSFRANDPAGPSLLRRKRFLGELAVLRRLGVRIVWTLHNLGAHEGEQNAAEMAVHRELVLRSSVIAHCGALRLGLVVVPTNSASTQREIDVLLELASPRAAVLERDELRSWMPPDVITTGIDVGLPDAIVPELDGSSPDDPALLPFTSGTTGVPKGAPLSHGNLLARRRIL